MKKAAVFLALILCAWAAFGLVVRARRAPRPPPPPGECHGAWHVHTVKSDGRGTLADVIVAAKAAGLQFVVITDHNVLSPGDAGYRDGVLVIESTEVSSPYGHIVALGVPRELDKDERLKDTLGTIADMGGQAVLAHPLHPKRPFARWADDRWLGFEIVSADTTFTEALTLANVPKLVRAALVLPWDPGASVVAFYDRPGAELAKFDAFAAHERKVLFCSDDAHGWPTYRAAFEAFSMHVPVQLTGDAAVDSKAVTDALEDGRASCVFDAVAPAWGAKLERVARPGRPDFVTAVVEGGEVRVYHDGRLQPGDDRGFVPGPGEWRVEVTRRGNPWIFFNPVYGG